MQRWSLTQSSFDQFLAVLDGDRDEAGKKYEALRLRIQKFFEWRACTAADSLADEALDRVMRKIEAGEQIIDPLKYAYGVSRLVYLESLKAHVREEEISVDVPDRHEDPDEEDERRLACLEKCLGELQENSRAMILGYYRDDKQAKIDHRKLIAERFKISLNALRIKTLRIRTALEACVLKCMGAR
jgi:DNA-directed RNA polymerase specialized sigma24 family protein